jgi:cysteinyl-tRNA synthetase
MLATLWLTPMAGAAQSDKLETGCPPAQTPAFVSGSAFATLKASLGQAMGEPLTCVAEDPATGDALQWTSTGLAFYRKSSDLATFTNGDWHWALMSGGVVEWKDGSIMPQALPAAAGPATLPPEDHGIAYCGVDIMTHLDAHIDLATGQVAGGSTSVGNAGQCFETHFRACEPASMTTYLVIASYRTEIVGPADDGSCQVVSSYPDNVNPSVVGQAMTCDLDPQRPFLEAVKDHTRCGGPLFDLIYGEQHATFIPAEAAPPALSRVATWLYLLDTNLSDETVTRIEASDYDLVVLDYIPSEQNNSSFPIADVIARLHNAPKPKLVLAYVDIGQAENYRTYWQPGWRVGSPDWITGDDPDGWAGNHPVAFWRDTWRHIWLGDGGYLAGIVATGFNGVYLDWIEAYSDPRVGAVAQRDGLDPRGEMLRFVADIAQFGRARRPGFLIVGQNAVELAADDHYLGTVDAVAQEQVWFDGSASNDPPGDCPLPATESDVDTDAYRASLPAACRAQFDQYSTSTLHVSTEHYLQGLAVARARGAVVLTVDYAVQPENVARIYQASRALGYIPYVAPRALDRYLPPR